MKQRPSSQIIRLLSVLLSVTCISNIVRAQDMTDNNGNTPTNSPNASRVDIMQILNGMDIQKVILGMQQDGRLAEIASMMATGAYGDIDIERQCMADILIMVQGVLDMDMWALQMIDAIGKPHSGIISDLDITWLGSYDECVGIQAVTHTNDTLQTEPEHHFDVGKSVFNVSDEYEADAECHDGIPIETRSIVAICIVSIIGLVVIIGTLYDIALRLAKKPEAKYVEPTSAPTDHIHTNGGFNGDVKVDLSVVNGGHINGDVDMKTMTNGDVLVTANGKPTSSAANSPREHSTLEKLFLAFSVYSNGLKLLSTNQPRGALTCINGIRFFSMTWVLLGHSLSFQVKNAIPYFFNKKLMQWTFYGIYSATVSVDTFFTMSGLLVAYLTLRELSKRGGAKRLNWFMFYFHRYWRLTPAYMLVLMVYATLYKYLGDGPKWPQKDIDFCAESWWTNLLYVNNYVKTDKGCFGWSWYLANDMQFYIVSPLIIIPLFYNVKVGGVVAFLFFALTTTARAYVTKQHEYTALFGAFIGPTAKDRDYMTNLYFPAHTRMGPYIVGLLAGYLLYRYKDTFKMKRTWNLLGWFVCFAIIVLIIYGVYPDHGNHFLTVDESVAYVTLSRTGWALAVSWIIFACATGHGGWINDFLSWSPFAPLGRLSYCSYLVHLIVIQYYQSSGRINVYETDLELIYFYLGNVVLSYLVAFVTSLLFEAPMMGLEKVLFKK